MSARAVPPLHGPIALRAFTVRDSKHARRGARRAPQSWPDAVLLFDTETSIDPSQRLLFGSYRYCRWNSASELTCVQEGVFYADELPSEDSNGFEILRAHAHNHKLRFLSRTEFVERVFFPAACRTQAIVAGFNLPFDLSRIAVGVSDARRRFYGGFSFALAEYLNPDTGERIADPFYARVCVKHLDSKRAFIGFAGGREPRKGKGIRGRFLDLKTLAFALTNIGHALRSACEAFHVENGKTDSTEHGRITDEYVQYNRRDVLASQELLAKLRAEFDRHPIALDPCHAFSPASIAKAYLRALGVGAPLTQFSNISPSICGAAMSAYYGGRAEAHIRKCAVPVVLTDFVSMYPTVNANMRLWDILTAESLKLRDATADVRAQLDAISLDQCFVRESWSDFVYFALVRASDDMLPVRAQYSTETDGWNIGVNPLSAEFDQWFAGPDLIASKLLSGKSPNVIRAFRIVPHGKQSSLAVAKLGGAIVIDPMKTDFFRAIIEMRKSLPSRDDLSRIEKERLDQFLKVLANSGSYGVFAEMNREDLPIEEREDVTLYGIDEVISARTNAPETVGAFCFPPLAALIPSAARLMLAMLERCVTDLGGQYAFCDTDSMAIVATEAGGRVECIDGPLRTVNGNPAIAALTWVQVRGIAGQFRVLSPYDPEIIPGSILKIEDVNFAGDLQRELFAYVISAKRYALFTRDASGTSSIEKASEHGLGHLLNPLSGESGTNDWISELWHTLIQDAIS
jgi:hypothetical protein